MSMPQPNLRNTSVRRLGNDTLTVACVYRTGSPLYSIRYVEILQDMVRRNLTLPHRFVCLSDDENVPCERIPLVTGWPGFYAKIELFRPGLFSGPVLYFDLDTVIHRNIDALGDVASKLSFGCVSDPMGGHMNTSVQSFAIDCSFIFESFQKINLYDRYIRPHIRACMHRFGLEKPFNAGSSYGDQGFSEMCLNSANIPIVHIDQVLPNLIATYGWGVRDDIEPVSGVCMMMGRPKPHEVPSGWIAHHWRTGLGEARTAGSEAV